jgi:hypothetical protein
MTEKWAEPVLRRAENVAVSHLRGVFYTKGT